MSAFRIKTYVLGQVSTNCYFIYKEGEKQAVVIDPGDNSAYILQKCKELGITPVAVCLTHGHFDHMLAADELRKAWGCKVYASVKEDTLLKDPSMNLSGMFGGDQIGVVADTLVRDGELLNLAGFEIQVIETPGHTAGSVCYWIPEEGVLISGDTLFADSLGRTDLPTSNSREIITSITETLFALPEDTMVYPGHGDPTTIGHEKKHNPVAVYYRP